MGDVDEDGVADIAISVGGEIRIIRGEARRTPAFTEAISPLVAPAIDLMLADIDMEGDLDLLLASGEGPVQLSLNEGRNFRSLEDSPDLGASEIVNRIVAVRDLDLSQALARASGEPPTAVVPAFAREPVDVAGLAQVASGNPFA